MMQTKNKLNQELQQAKKDYNVLQLDVDRVRIFAFKINGFSSH